ncbi:polynucleotidyl ribonuclease H-like superfamily protein, partial [Trifolium medium]|nr:polynucleotidyl ribonuclease H-like superfamily protein [Trifolium medium]
MQSCKVSADISYSSASVAVPRSLRNFLRNPNHTFVGFWNHSDRRKLESSDHRLEMCRDPFDLRLCAEAEDENDDEDLRLAPMHKIVKKCIGYEVE